MYSKDNLVNFTFGELIEIILRQENEIASLNEYKEKCSRVAKIVGNPIEKIEAPTPKVKAVVATNHTGKRGRPSLTPEEKAKAYERQKQRQKEKYWAKKEVV